MGNRPLNGTVSKKANSTCAPGNATRSSFRSSMSSRLSRSSGSSPEPPDPSFDELRVAERGSSTAQRYRRTGCAKPRRTPRGLSSSDHGYMDAEVAWSDLVEVGSHEPPEPRVSRARSGAGFGDDGLRRHQVHG